MQRRTFLKAGLLGGTALACAGWLSHDTFWGKGTHLAAKGDHRYDFLTEADHAVVSALAPAVLAGSEAAGNPKLTEEVVHAVDQTIAAFQPSVQAELRQLFTLMTLAPTRVLVCGLWRDWPAVTPDDADAMLRGWHASRTALLRSAYDGLQQLITAAWYGNPRSWPALGYAGPPPFHNNGEVTE
ncbi:hypothetical protein [Acanthopleuribacter pedis]|uniref:Twin-arginine translocation pathway signal protein n=1 Tax=Acanthopleuribacter pedis TaxID=442870 RepID=A0A8J7Q819_9BACT|nr:hypothetical protein [Acanthopleuribacter pedis]MBO1320131.1 hypothetical protein [Acanthopleuribacter pedis]